MTIVRYAVVRAILALVLLETSVAAAHADDLLYASDGKQLFTVDLQTGATTFVSDGPLQWIASPAFDEPHHTRLWIEGFPRDLGFPFGTAWVAQDGAQFSWGNPFTGDSGGPYPATVSYFGSSWGEGKIILFGRDAVYAPTTEKLYTIGQDFIVPGDPIYILIMIDPYNGPALPDWGGWFIGSFWDVEQQTALAFDSTSGLILQAYSGTSDDGGRGYGIRAIAILPHQGSDPVPPVSTEPFTSITAMAVEPATGDLYFLRVQTELFQTTTTMTFMHRERTTGQETPIAELPLASWSMTFADAKYIQ